MKRVLVTGATGFIGLHCLGPLVDRGFEVHALGHSRKPENSPPVSWHSADLLAEREAQRLVEIVRPTHLLHLAWYVTSGKYWTAPENLQWVQASLDLAQAFAAHGGRRVVAAGTCAEYDWSVARLSERSTRLAPRTLYGASKLGLFTILDAYALQTGLSAAWGRIFHLFGPHEPPERLVPSVCISLLRGEEALCTHGEQARDLLYVEDAADAFAAILDSEVTGPVNIGSGVGLPLKRVVSQLAKQLDASDRVRLGALPARPQEPPELYADVTRITREVGWSPRIGLDLGIERTIAWWKSRLAQDAGKGA